MKGNNIVLASDGSVHLADETAAAAWLVSEDDDHEQSALVLMAGMTSFSSYRTELEGMYRAMNEVTQRGLLPRSTVQWCDNEKAVEAASKPPANPSGMLSADADIILAIHHLRERYPGRYEVRHVYAHQDTRKAPTAPRQKKKKGGIVIDRAEERDARKTARPPPPTPTPSSETSESDDSTASSSSSEGGDVHSDDEASPRTVHLSAPLSFPYRRRPQIAPVTPQTPPRQPVRNPYRPATPASDKKLTREARLNVKCDELASNTTEVVIAQGGHPEVAATMSLPFEGSKALLKLGRTWVTSKYKRAIARAHRRPHSVPTARRSTDGTKMTSISSTGPPLAGCEGDCNLRSSVKRARSCTVGCPQPICWATFLRIRSTPGARA